MDIFWQGIIIGFSIAAPVGPIGVLCIRHTLAHGRLSGLLSGLGAATADAFYGSVASFGLTFISMFLLRQQMWFQTAGGFFLCYLGIRTLFSQPASLSPGHMQAHTSYAGTFLSTFMLTLTNPATILSFAAIYSGLGLAGGQPNAGLAVSLVTGVFLGSAAWWLTLSSIVNLFRFRVNSRTLVWINRASGAIIGSFGLIILVALFF
jgi:threonine/homoserine/homoserine lactone efflux protein